RFPTPFELVQALHGLDSGPRHAAQQQLLEELGEAVRTIVETLLMPHQARGRVYDLAEWHQQTVSGVLLHVRSRPVQNYTGWRWDTFTAELLLVAYGWVVEALECEDDSPLAIPSPAPLRVLPGHRASTYFRPLQRLGGDWYAGAVEKGWQWTAVFDVRGHGCVASLVARGVALLWSTPRVEQARASGMPPTELLDLFHEELEALLWRVHVAAVVGRFDPQGLVHVSYAGDCRCLRARPGAQVEINTEGGSLLG